MKRILSIILSLVMLIGALPLTANAAESDLAETGDYNGTTGDCTWSYKYVEGDMCVTISGNGYTADYDAAQGNPSPFQDTITKKVDIKEGVKGLGTYFFIGCSQLTNVSFPNTLLRIGQGAFARCNLKEVTIPDSVTVIESNAFYMNKNLKKFKFGNSVERIGSLAFWDCSLNDVTLPNSLEFIGTDAFYNNRNLRSVTIPASVTEIEEGAFGFYPGDGHYYVKDDDFIIIGEKGTEAERYAVENGFQFVPFGSLTIFFDAGGGSGTMKSEYVQPGTVYTLPECTFTPPEGKMFDRWKVNDSYTFGNKITVNEDTLLQPHWVDACTVSFNPNGGSGSMESVTVAKGSSYTLPECTFTPPEGKVFSKWLEGIFTNYAPGESFTVEDDTTIRAIWKNAPANTCSISGTVTSYLSDTEPTTIILSKKSGDDYVYKDTQTVSGNSASYIFNDIAKASQYKLTVSKKNHVDREYTVTVLISSKTVDLKICPIGDVSGDGKVTSRDSSQAFQISQGKGNFDNYQRKCGDVVKNDGKVTSADASRIFQHTQGKINLWS